MSLDTGDLEHALVTAAGAPDYTAAGHAQLGEREPRDEPRYVYVRGGERFVISSGGCRYTDSAGTVWLDRSLPLPDDVIAATIVGLSLAGWVSDTPKPPPEPPKPPR